VLGFAGALGWRGVASLRRKRSAQAPVHQAA
jgi:hypothetical protein